jgi:hypothetical protein
MRTYPSHDSLARLRTAGRCRLNWTAMMATLHDETALAFSEPSELLIDLKPFSVLSPDALVVIMALLRYRGQHAPHKTAIAVPNDRDGISHLSATGFLSLVQHLNIPLANVSPIELFGLESSPSRDPLLKRIRPLLWVDIDRVTASIPTILSIELDRRDISIPAGSERQGWLFSFRHLLQEILTNALDHFPGDSSSTSQAVGFACYRPWPRSYPKLRFACSDVGEGFRASLKRRHSIQTRTDVQAIYEGFLFRARPSPQKVVGLFDALAFLRVLAGRLSVSSLRGRVTFDLGNDRDRRLFSTFQERPSLTSISSLGHANLSRSSIPGTHYCIDLNFPASDSL